MHLQYFEAGALGTNAIVGGGVPLAAGNAWAQSKSLTNNITVSYFGDGAVNIGSVLETMNLAAAWKLPLAFFIENIMSIPINGGLYRKQLVKIIPCLKVHALMKKTGLVMEKLCQLNQAYRWKIIRTKFKKMNRWQNRLRQWVFFC